MINESDDQVNDIRQVINLKSNSISLLDRDIIFENNAHMAH